MVVLRRTVVTVAVGLVAALLSHTTTLPASALGPLADTDPGLTAALQAADPTETVVAVAVVDQAVATVLPSLDALGIDTVAYDELPMIAVRGTPAQLTAATAVGGVVSLWADTVLDVALEQSTELIGATTVHDDPALGFDGSGIGIAVLDSGIDGLHPDIEYPTKTVQNVKILGNQHVFESLTFTVEDVANTDTTTGHGTHVAGIAAGDGTASDGTYAGVAPGAHLVGVGSADGVEMLTALAGYDWILANHDTHGIRVINNSWADGEIAYDPDHPLNLASKAAHDEGIVVVFAAGNDGQASGNVYNRYAYPDWVIGVGGTTKLGTLGDYSSAGDDTHHPDVMAPGSFIASTRASTGFATNANSSPFDFTDPLNPRIIAPEHTLHYTAAIGTSMSAPHVAGVVALVLDANPDLTPGEVRDLLIATASPMPGCPVAHCGAGMVNAVAAVQGALAAVNAAPVAVIGAAPTNGAAPLAVIFDGRGSTDSDGLVAAHRWDLDGDGTFETEGEVVTRTYAAGSTTVALVVVDDDGASSSPATIEIRSSDAPTAAATVDAKATSGEPVTFDATASSDADGTIVEYRFWFGDGAEVVTTSPVVSHAYSATRTTRFAWRITVIDDAGVADATTGTIKVKKSH